MSVSIHPEAGLSSGLPGSLRTSSVLVGIAALLLAAVLGAVWQINGDAAREWARESEAVQDDLREAHTSLLGARVSLYERNLQLASRHLEDARELLRRAEARGGRRGRSAEVLQHDLTRFESDIDDAQRLLVRLVQERSSAPSGAPLDAPDR